MKNRLLPLFVVLGSLSAYSQVGNGTRTPDTSAQLEIKAEDGLGKGRGLLIPRVSLTSATDKASIFGGQPAESLLVYNLTDSATLKIGYCYWSNGKWNRLGTTGDGSGMTGIAGGDGKPGDAGVTIPADATLWIDSSTGVIYVKDPVSGEWKEAKNGIDGIAGTSGLPETG